MIQRKPGEELLAGATRDAAAADVHCESSVCETTGGRIAEKILLAPG